MSCWVVPTVAAELWGMSVQQIMDGISAGHLMSKSEAGFTFIDVAPQSPRMEAPRPMRPPTPPTFMAVTNAEIAALTDEPSDDEMQMLSDWRDARHSVSRQRRAPLAA